MRPVSEEQLQTHEEMFAVVYKNDPEAIRVSLELVQMLHVWDDLIDGDRPVAVAEINAAFMAALCEVSGSSLWDRQAAELCRVAYLKWQSANYFEKQAGRADENQRIMSFVFRAGFVDLFYYFAYKLYGMEWAQSVGPIILSWYGEDFTEYCEEFWERDDGTR